MFRCDPIPRAVDPVRTYSNPYKRTGAELDSGTSRRGSVVGADRGVAVVVGVGGTRRCQQRNVVALELSVLWDHASMYSYVSDAGTL
jgi:hypothetical protein